MMAVQQVIVSPFGRCWTTQTYANRWIGRCGPILCSARSPHLTPLDIYVWRYMKTEQMNQMFYHGLQKPEVRKRIRTCIRNQGRDIE
nr:unnamed protein product [Callosobruchus chinensis]